MDKNSRKEVLGRKVPKKSTEKSPKRNYRKQVLGRKVSIKSVEKSTEKNPWEKHLRTVSRKKFPEKEFSQEKSLKNL